MNPSTYTYFFNRGQASKDMLKKNVLLTKASCRPMFPMVITPAKKIQGNQERMYRKSGEVYLSKRKTIL